MKLAMMQPYLFPYIGYFKLIDAVDYFGIGDEVQFIKRGWINRNRLLGDNEPLSFSFPVKKDSHLEQIKNRVFYDDILFDKKKLLKSVTQIYSKAPYYSDVLPLLEKIVEYDERNVSKFITYHLKIISEYLHIETLFLNSHLWEFEHDENLSSEEKLIGKLHVLRKSIDFDCFINPIGGSHLYDKETFLQNGFNLFFIDPVETPYNQLDKNFTPDLSIIDVMMFNNVEEISRMLKLYILR